MNTSLYQDSKKKILDVFLFFNEIELLKIRLAFLGPYVDYFVISEANCDFSGRPKQLILNESFIKTLPYSHKIILHHEYINLKEPAWLLKRLRYTGRKPKLLWKIQDAQRNSTLKALKNFQNHDLIIFGDLDEFPSPASIDLISHQTTLHESYSCSQHLYYYNLRTIADSLSWYGTIFTSLENFRKILPHKIRSMRDDLPHLDQGGWHFSYFMSPDKIKQKINAIGSVEKITNHSLIQTTEIEEKIKSQKDMFDRNIQYRSSIKEHEKVPESLKKLFELNLPNAC